MATTSFPWGGKKKKVPDPPVSGSLKEENRFSFFLPMRPLTYGSGPSEKPYLPRPQQAPVGIARWHFRLLRKPKLFSAALHNSAKNIYRRNPGKKKTTKKNTVPGQMLGCQWLTGSYLSFNLSLSFFHSLILPLSISLCRFWFGTEESDGNCSELGRQLRSVPLTKGYKAQPFR